MENRAPYVFGPDHPVKGVSKTSPGCVTTIKHVLLVLKVLWN